MRKHLLSYLLVYLLFPLCSRAEGIIEAYRLDQPIRFDGRVDEAVWDDIPTLDMVMQQPNFGQPPSERSEIRLAYDDQYLYLSGRFFLSDSSYYRATTFKRDALDGTTDYFGFNIDSYNDKENSLAFFTAPTGLRWDGTIANDALEDANLSIDWNTFWDAAATRTADGWNAELRIPWTSLRFQDKDGEVIMGITVWWWIAAKNEVDIFPSIPLNWGGMSQWKPSQAQEFRFRQVFSNKPLYIAPYLLAGYQESHELNAQHSAYDKYQDPKLEAGLDVKYNLTSNLTLDLTANTDFAQVEADDQQVNLSRFSLFFPEKRLFFQERASIFNFQFEDFNRLFYSRNVGIYDGDIVRILGGAKLVGRVSGHDLGFMNMQTAKSDSLAAENFSVLRVRRQAFNQFSWLGAMATHRTDLKGHYNTVYGFDGMVRVVGDEYLTARWAQSFENGKANRLVAPRSARTYLQWERRRYDGFVYKLVFSRAGEDYIPGIGFEQREDFSSLRADLSYGIVKNEEAKLLRMRYFVRGFGVRDNAGFQTQSAQIEAGLEFETKKGWFATGWFRPSIEYVAEAFDLGDTEVPVGEYRFAQGTVVGGTPFNKLVAVFGDLTLGGFYGGKLVSFGLAPRVKLSAHFELEGYYQYNRAVFSDRMETFNSQIGRLKLQYLLNTKVSVAAFLQYNSVEETFFGNIRFRYNPREGNDLFIVYNDILNSRRGRETPRLPGSDSRVLVVKYTYTFSL